MIWPGELEYRAQEGYTLYLWNKGICNNFFETLILLMIVTGSGDNEDAVLAVKKMDGCKGK